MYCIDTITLVSIFRKSIPNINTNLILKTPDWPLEFSCKEVLSYATILCHHMNISSCPSVKSLSVMPLWSIVHCWVIGRVLFLWWLVVIFLLLFHVINLYPQLLPSLGLCWLINLVLQGFGRHFQDTSVCMGIRYAALTSSPPFAEKNYWQMSRKLTFWYSPIPQIRSRCNPLFGFSTLLLRIEIVQNLNSYCIPIQAV